MPVDLSDVKEQSVDRDENGELVAEEKEFTYEGETETVNVLPATGGLANRIAKHEEGLEELDPKSVAAVLSVMCPDLKEITAEDVRDMYLPFEIGLVNAVAEQLPEVEIDEGNQ